MKTQKSKPGSKKTPVEKTPPRKPSSKWETAIVVALIALVGTIVTVVAPLIDKRIPTSTPAPSFTPVAGPTDTLAALMTNTAEATLTVWPTLTPTIPPTSSAVATLPSAMTASLRANMTEGKAPLNVNFDARGSSYRFADGTTVSCGEGFLCTFTFAVYFNSKAQVTVDNRSGVYSHSFNTKGEYFVSLYVCRDTACDDDGILITVR